MQTQTTLSKLEKILDLAKQYGVSEAEVIESSWTENPVNFENNKLKTLESNEKSGIAIRLIKNNKVGLSSSTDPDSIEKIVTSAIEASEYGPEATFEFTKENLKEESNKPQATSQKLLPIEELVERGTNVIESLKPFHKDLLVSGGFNLGHGQTLYLNSNGVSGKRTKSVYSCGFAAQLIRGEDFLGIYEESSSLDGFVNEKEIINKLLEKLNYSRENVSLKTKKYPVIFTPRAVSGIFGNILSEILNGKLIQQGISPLTGKLGAELFDKKLTFVEDPNTGTSKAEFDDEGIKTKRKILIKNGIVNNFYFDLSTAGKMKVQSSGNGFKPGLGLAAVPALTSVEIDKGNISHIDLIKDIKEGILVDQLLGAGQSNTLAGEFSVGIELGFKIKDGKIQGRIKNCMLAANIFEVLKNIKELSSDRDWIGGSELVPYFLIENLLVATR